MALGITDWACTGGIIGTAQAEGLWNGRVAILITISGLSLLGQCACWIIAA